MEKQKQIEDLTAIIDSFNIKTYENAKSVAKFIIDKYNYRKINENEVVISKKEYEKLVSLEKAQAVECNTIFNMRNQAKKEVEQARKETAEKFAKELRNFIYLCDDLELDADTYGKISNKMDEIAKQFGVEIGEDK